MQVVVRRDRDGTLLFRRRTGENARSLCEGLSLHMPEVVFQAEIMSTSDGHLVGRIMLRSSPSLDEELKRTIPTIQLEPLQQTGYTRFFVDREPLPDQATAYEQARSLKIDGSKIPPPSAR